MHDLQQIIIRIEVSLSQIPDSEKRLDVYCKKLGINQPTHHRRIAMLSDEELINLERKLTAIVEKQNLTEA